MAAKKKRKHVGCDDPELHRYQTFRGLRAGYEACIKECEEIERDALCLAQRFRESETADAEASEDEAVRAEQRADGARSCVRRLREAMTRALREHL